MLDEGVYNSVREISEAERIGNGYVSRILRLALALVAPEIVDAVVEGRADTQFTLKTIERPLPASWEEQLEILR